VTEHSIRSLAMERMTAVGEGKEVDGENDMLCPVHIRAQLDGWASIHFDRVNLRNSTPKETKCRKRASEVWGRTADR
jgi:hypothetical protein